MELVIELSEKSKNGFYKATVKDNEESLFNGKTIKECIARSREFARTLKLTGYWFLIMKARKFTISCLSGIEQGQICK